MTNEDVLKEFREAGALREGHFALSSGLHSSIFLQKNLCSCIQAGASVFAGPWAAAITEKVGSVDVCVSPAVGGIIPGYETARHLSVPSICVEREAGVLKFRRPFDIEPGERVAVVEDIISAGVSSPECVQTVEASGGQVVCAACIVDRSAGRADPRATVVPLATPDVPAWPADALPPELAALPEEDPGSRRLYA
jgi:orotate phosphoribosyltransferase